MLNALGAIFEFLFKYRPAVFARGDFAWGAPAPILVLLVLGALIAVPAVRSYRAVRGKSTPQDRRVLLGLRVALLVVLIGCLLRPMLLLNAAVPQRNYVGVLVDDSRSMRIADRGGRTRADFVRDSVDAADAAVMKQLRQRFLVREFRFGATATRVDAPGALAFDANETRLGAAIEGVRGELESVPLSGLVVFSDGADNARTAFADQLLSLRAKSVPVFTVGIGREEFTRDIEVRRVESDRDALRGSTLIADVLIRQRGFSGDKVPLVIEDGGRVVGRSEIVLPRDGDLTPVRVQVQLTESGARTLTFRIALQPGEQVEQNNEQQLLVRVRDGREKVLYFEGEPRHELRFIKAAVEADSNLQLVALQRTADGKFFRMNIDGPDELAAGFPVSRGELFKYRAIILGSVEASFFTSEQLAMLADFVNTRGGGLLFLGGRRAFGEGGYAGTPLAEVMPVVIEGAAVPDEKTFLADLTSAVTPAGMNSAVTQVAASPEKSAERWRTLPSVTTVNRIVRVKPGATTLIAGRVPKQGRVEDPNSGVRSYEQPILVYQRYGRGLAVALPVQDTWIWQMHADIPVGDPTYPTFWRQLLRFLTADVPTRVQATLSADAVNPKTPVELRASVADSLYSRRNDAHVVAHLKSPSGALRDVPLDWTVDRDGEYRATFTPDEIGVYAVRIEATDPTAPTAAAAADTTYLRVAELNAEYVDAEMRASLLKRIADETGGRFYTTDRLSTLAEDVAMSRRGVTVVNEMDLWDMPINFLVIVLLASAEWGYRKWRGLA